MENILFLSSFVFIPLLMLLGLWLSRNINQVRGVMVAGSTALLILAAYLTIRFLGDRAAGADAEMLYTGALTWFEGIFPLVHPPEHGRFRLFHFCRHVRHVHVL